MGRSKLFGLLALVALAAPAGAGCESKPARKEPASAAKSRIAAATRDDLPAGLAAKQLEARGLEKRWDFNLGEPILSLWLLDDCLYAYTRVKSSYSIYAIRLEDGLTRWKYDLPSELSYAPGAYIYPKEGGERRTDELFLVTKDTLHVLDRDHGFLLWKKQLGFAAASPPSASLTHIYIGSWDGRIYAIQKSDRHVDWSYLTDAPVSTRARVPDDEGIDAVFVASEDGRVYSFNPVSEERKWAYPTRGRIVAPPFFFKTYLYVGSTDMNLYAIRSLDGNLEWRYPTGAPITREPIAFPAAADTVFVVSGESNLLAVNRRPDPKTKEYLRWSFPEGVQVLAKGRRDVYVADVKGRVVALAESNGKPRWVEPLECEADFFVSDPFDPGSTIDREKRLASTLVFGYRDGWLVAVREKSEY